MRKIFIYLLVAGLGSCTVSQVHQDLDSELSPQGKAYLDSMSLSIKGVGILGNEKQNFSASQLEHPIGSLNVETSKARMFSSFLPWFFTLGVFPGSTSSWFEQTVKVDVNGKRQEVRTLTQTSSYSGWIAWLLWVSPNWSFGQNPDMEELMSRAFITTVNDLAEQSALETESQ
jgi:hypothetical protein